MGILEKLGFKKRKPKPQPEPVYKAPLDPALAITVAESLRDVKLLADNNGITLKNTMPARSKAVMDLVERDDYVTAKAEVGRLDTDVKAEKLQKTGYEAAYAGVPEKLASLPALNATPVPLQEIRQEIADMDKARADFVAPATQEYAKAKSTVEDIKPKITAFEIHLATFKTREVQFDAYVKAYAGLPERIAKLPALTDTSGALKTKRQEVIDADKSRADLIKPNVQNYVGAKAAAETLKTKIDECSKAVLDAKLKATPPDKAGIKALVKAGEGPVLDALVKSLGATPDRAIIQAAVEARFGITFTMTGEGTDDTSIGEGNKSLARIYEVMSKLPDSHTIGNKKFKMLERISGAPGADNYYQTVNKRSKSGAQKEVGRVVLQAGLPGNVSSMYAIGDAGELPGVEQKWLNDGFAKPSYFDWQTLHEAGHAVDDGKGIMRGLQATALGGEWKRYATTDDVAAEVNAEFKYDLSYVKKKLKGETPGPVACPTPGKEGDWNAAKVRVDAFANAVLNTANIWDDGTVSTTTACAGDFTYHSPYGRDWVRYKTTARQNGVTGYQFRAPGEWFSELYAAYWTGILKKGHPVVAKIEEYGKRP